MEYHPEASGQVENLKKIVSRLQHYIVEHQTELESYVVPLRYVFSTQVHRATRLPTLSLVRIQQPPCPATPTASPIPPDVEH